MSDVTRILQSIEDGDPQAAEEPIKIRFFAGLSIEKAAQALGVSTSTVENDWAYARSWLRIEMAAADDANLRP